jgi:multidrug efflux pump
MGRIEAALKGASEVGFTVLSISISLVAVFIPLLFMGGVVGRLFREFAVTLSSAVMISLLLSLTTTPMLCATLLRPGAHRTEGRIGRTLERGYARIERGYERLLDWALQMRGLVLLLLALVVALTVYLYIAVPKGFFPQQDAPILIAGVRADESVSFQSMQRKLGEVVGIIHGDRAVQSVVGFTGGRRAGGAFMLVSLKPKGPQRRDPGMKVIMRLQARLAHVSGIRLFLFPMQDLRIGARSSNSTYQYTMVADDTATLRLWTQKLSDALGKRHELTDIDSDLSQNGIESFVHIDREAAARVGISPRDVDNALYDAFGQRSVANIYEDINQYSVILGWDERATTGPAHLPDVRVPAGSAADGAAVANSTAATAGGTLSSGATSAASDPSQAATQGTGQASATPTNPALRDPSTGNALSTTVRRMVPLDEIAQFGDRPTESSIEHTGGQVSTTISFNTAPGFALSDAVRAIAEAEAAIAMPSDVYGSFGGQAATARDQQGQQPLLILAALVSIYIVLGMLYESLIHPLTVLSTLPAAGVGAVLALMVVGMEFTVIALIGVFLLLGIVKKNAILIIDFALEAQRSRGLSALEAAREASILRFRPILMTTLAAALGALPLAIGFGEGAELRRPLGVAIVGGLIASQLITLVTTPVVYVTLDRFTSTGRARRRRLRFRKQPA